MTHPIEVPPELIAVWVEQHRRRHPTMDAAAYVARKAAEWGAGAQLEKCFQWLQQWDNIEAAKELRAAMRPKPPSLKEQALAVLDDCADSIGAVHENALRRALERLPDES